MNEEANLKLLEFAEFKYDPLTCDCSLCQSQSWVAPDAKKFPNGTMVHCEPPDFFDTEHGLGWIFKYLVPKVAPTSQEFANLLKEWIKNIDAEQDYTEALANAILNWLESK